MLQTAAGIVREFPVKTGADITKNVETTPL